LSPTTRNREGPVKPERSGYGVAPCLSMPALTRAGRAPAVTPPKAVNPSTGGDETLPTLRVPVAAPVTRT
jgi:hypothetical protein